MSSYGDMAWTYSEEDLGIDPETKLTFVPNKKELDLFKQEKTNMYKGTWMLCFVYGLSAVILLSIIFFAEWGRNYIYNKFLPAVITYVVGAIFIIIYLVTSIFSLKPRKIGKGTEAMPICPDYWQLKETTEQEKKDIVANITSCRNSTGGCSKLEKGLVNKQYILKNDSDPVINSVNSKYLKYKCVPDENVFGNIDNIIKQKSDINVNTSFVKTSASGSPTQDKYIYNNLGDTGENNESIKKYAQVSGIYKNDWKHASGNDATTTADLFGNTVVLKNGSAVDYGYEKNPLICNVVYPNIIGAMEDTKNTDKLRCEYADKCGISWSKLDCIK
jgi:hypothetical protein